MMVGAEEEKRGSLGVEGALELIWGGSGIVWESRGANQEESSCWKVMLLLLLLSVVVLVRGTVDLLTLIQWLFR
jgi:hypothetical protein